MSPDDIMLLFVGVLGCGVGYLVGRRSGYERGVTMFASRLYRHPPTGVDFEKWDEELRQHHYHLGVTGSWGKDYSA
jgi:membrane protein DedA with SNARE-associated domain